MYESKLKSDDLDKLFAAILTMNTVEECYMFFEDLCTISELGSISQRLKVAALLNDKHTCHDISQSTGASTATISRVNRCLHYGTGGYEMALQRIREV
ncbi:MAG: YerC/YecD family TrpR-related protein [Eubacteriales bacterium]|nr:YerC/YecD family TrpR-related protein [Eubacteriales bacterium]